MVFTLRSLCSCSFLYIFRTTPGGFQSLWRPGGSAREHPGRIKEGTLDKTLKQSQFLILIPRASTRINQQKSKRIRRHYRCYRELWFSGTLDCDWPRDKSCLEKYSGGNDNDDDCRTPSS